MPKLTKKAALVLTAAAVGVALSSTAAYAYWSSAGTGSGSAPTSAGAGNAVTISDDSASLSGMYPGDSPQTVTVAVLNSDSAQSAYVSTVTAFLTVTKAAGAPAGTCDESDYLLDGTAGVDSSSPASLTWTASDLAAGAQASTTFTLQFNNKSASNQDACKGASVDITYASS